MEIRQVSLSSKTFNSITSRKDGVLVSAGDGSDALAPSADKLIGAMHVGGPAVARKANTCR